MLAELSGQQYLTLDLVPRLGVARIQELLELSSGELFTSSPQQLQAWGLTAKQAQGITQPQQQRIDHCLEWLASSGCQLIGCFDERYPEALRQIQRPPLLLFARGNLELLQRPAIAMVGSRHASWQGLQQAKLFAQQLAESGLTVCSGLALGIDAAAHHGALEARADATIAVVATGLDRVYPKRHHALAKQIIEKSLIISEFWPGTPAKATHFPRRNRIISGLSLGVVVVEAALPSGSLLTANYAAEQGRDVFAIPGPVDDPLRAGCHLLIQQGAKLLTRPVEVLEEYGITEFGQATELGAVSETDKFAQLPNQQLLDNVDYETTSIDELVSRSQLPVDAVLAQITELEILGVVAAVPGGYVRQRRNDDV